MYILMNQSGLYIAGELYWSYNRDEALRFTSYAEAFNARPFGYRIIELYRRMVRAFRNLCASFASRMLSR